MDTSINHNSAMEKKLKGEKKMWLGRAHNRIIALPTSRVTAGVLADTGLHKLLNPKLREVTKTKLAKTKVIDREF